MNSGSEWRSTPLPQMGLSQGRVAQGTQPTYTQLPGTGNRRPRPNLQDHQPLHQPQPQQASQASQDTPPVCQANLHLLQQQQQPSLQVTQQALQVAQQVLQQQVPAPLQAPNNQAAELDAQGHPQLPQQPQHPNQQVHQQVPPRAQRLGARPRTYRGYGPRPAKDRTAQE